jgi:hypothetical protein
MVLALHQRGAEVGYILLDQLSQPAIEDKLQGLLVLDASPTILAIS